MVWLKGSLHTHTSESDGDQTPELVSRWYQEHGYDFLVISDHNHLTVIDEFEKKKNELNITLIPGEEVTVHIGGIIPVHLNGIGIKKVVKPIETSDIVSTLQKNIDGIIDAGGLASINHPNLQWTINHNHILQTQGAHFIEVYNAVLKSNNFGGLNHHSTDQIWDEILSTGTRIMGVATDDAHNYHDFSFDKKNPGRGWVMVQSKTNFINSILEALSSGNFYSTNGVEITDLCMSKDLIELQFSDAFQFQYRTLILGQNGAILDEIAGNTVRYNPKDTSGYIRTKTFSSAGTIGWTQPLFL